MQGHITELKSPQKTTAHMATLPCVTMTVAMSRAARSETKARARWAGILRSAMKPMKRPIIDSPQ